MIKVSIITVVYNAESTIRDTILSVKNQDYHNIEHIIIDGASTDGTVSIIKEYNHLSKFLSEKDQGIYDAMNKGISAATGDVIGILNSDDVFANTSIISMIVDQFQIDISTDIVYGDLVYVASNNLDKIKRTWRSLVYYGRFFDDGHVPPHPTLYLKRSVYTEVGLFNVDFKLAADYEFMFRLFKKYHFKSVYIQAVFVRMRLGGATNKNLHNILKGNQEILKSWNINGLNPPMTLMIKRVYRRLIQFL